LFRPEALRQMTMSVTRTAEAPDSARGVLPLAIGAGVYLLLLFAGNRLLGDPDTLWQITIGQWILTHRMVPESNIYSFTMAGQSWIATQWLAQVGGHLIASGVPTFIDGRTGLFGEKFVVDHHLASELIEPERLFRLLKDHDIEATLPRTQSAAAKLLDHLDGWQKVHADGIATIHLRRPGAMHHAVPVIRPTTP
jgi:hypothetical protein